MNSLVSQGIPSKVFSVGRKFIFSLAVAENSSNNIVKNEQNLTPFDPFQFVNDCTKTMHYTLRNAKSLHACLLKGADLQSDMFYTNYLLDWYFKSASVVDAGKLFDTISQPNVISWNTTISGYNRNNLFGHSWSVFSKMRLLGFEPNEFTYGSVLSACTALKCPVLGKLVYSLSLKNGFYSNDYVRSGMIDLFAKNSSFEDALMVFCDVSSCDNVVCWNAIMSGAVRNGENWVAINLFHEMHSRFIPPNSFTFSSILTACATLEELETGKGVQGLVIKCSARDIFVGTAIVDLYAKRGEMNEAAKEFARLPDRNVVSWTALISGFVKKDDSTTALKTFKEMRKLRVEINDYTVTSVISACSNPHTFYEAIQLHSWILKTGVYTDSVVAAALINMYSKIGVIDFSEMVFKDVEHLQHPDTWAVMLSSFVQSHRFQSAVELFQRMLQKGLSPYMFCISSFLSIIDCSNLGRQIHSYALKTGFHMNLSVNSALFTMYSKCGSLEDSYKVFEQISAVDRDNVSWTSMIAGFAEHGCAYRALQLFSDMLCEGTNPDQTTLTAVLTASSALQSLQKGKEIHAYALHAGIAEEDEVGSALVNMYSKCNDLELARKMFDMLPEKNKVACSSLVSGYAKSGLVKEAVLLFHEMLLSELAVDSFIFSSLLGAVALSNRSGVGIQIHAHIIKMGLDTEASVGSSLATMYSKCGSIEYCHRAFGQIDEPDLVAWTAIIASYAEHGKGVEALRVYDLMRKDGIRPDSVTFVGVLSACSHSGLVEAGYSHLNSMSKDYGIEPSYRHYACMVDLLGRSGRLKEAENFIRNMPIEPNALVWGTLLAACKVHGDAELGKLAAEKVIQLEPCEAGAYVSLSNIYANIGKWEDVKEIRDRMKGGGLKKEPGWSFV